MSTSPHVDVDMTSFWNDPYPSNFTTIERIKSAFEQAGVEFPGNPCPGVRLKSVSEHTLDHLLPVYGNQRNERTDAMARRLIQRDRDWVSEEQWLKGTVAGLTMVLLSSEECTPPPICFPSKLHCWANEVMHGRFPPPLCEA